MNPGDRIIFKPGSEMKKPWRHGEYIGESGHSPEVVVVKLDNDPFSVCVNFSQVTLDTESPTQRPEVRSMAGTATATEPSTKLLRRLAKDQAVSGWEEMDRDELLEAVELPDDEAPAKKTTSKRTSSKKASAPRQRAAVEDEDDDEEDEEGEAPAPRRAKKTSTRPAKKATSKSAPPAKKAPAKKAVPAEAAEPAENGNPFREDTNLWYITEELIKGGKRSAMVKRLKRKIDLKPRQRAGDDYDEESELDRRILIVGQILRRDHGFNVVRDGRGAEAVILAEAP